MAEKYDKRKNLIDGSMRTREEMQAIGRKGAAAAAVSKRKAKTFRESIKAILLLDTPDVDKRAALEILGIEPTILNAINQAVSGKAADGDVEAARYLRDTVGERPREGLEIGNLDDKPLAAIDMSKLSDKELQTLAAVRAETAEE